MSPQTSLRGGRIYGQHGTRHAPRGSDPSAADPWRYVVDAGTAWSSDTTYDPGDEVDDGALRWEAIKASGPSALDPYGHSTGSIQPGVDDNWPAYWWCQASVWVNGSNMAPTIDIPAPVPLRYRLSVGAPNYIDTDTGTITFYTDHQIEIQGDVTGLASGDIVFIIPPEYRHDYDVPYQTHDDSKAFVACRLLSTGEFMWDTA